MHYKEEESVYTRDSSIVCWMHTFIDEFPTRDLAIRKAVVQVTPKAESNCHLTAVKKIESPELKKYLMTLK